jgi:hypothetical protein
MNEMGGACGTYERQARCIQRFDRDLREREHLEDLGADGRIILNSSLRSGMVAWTGWILLRIGTGDGLL